MRWLVRSFKALWAMVVVMTPTLGIWAASSLATYLGGPRWLAVACGVLLFPGLPLMWEWSRARHRELRTPRPPSRTGALAPPDPRPPRLSLLERLVLRTLVVNLVFLGLLVAWFHGQLFPALSTSGDWFLSGERGPGARWARSQLHLVAERLEWLHARTRVNEFAGLREFEGDPVHPTAPERPRPARPTEAREDHPPRRDAEPEIHDVHAWPAPATIHPAARDVPESATASVESLGRYFAGVDDPRARVRAMHDWVATHIEYDHIAVADGSYPSKQRAAQVLTERRGVCAGYSNLMVALGRVTGDHIVYIEGDARDHTGSIDGSGHAWNAVDIEGQWYLIDATWDSGSRVDGEARTFRTHYFMTPPDVFGVDHIPDDPRWQLREPPISRGEFLRQPQLGARFFANDFSLVSPRRSRVATSGKLEIVLDNPDGRYVMASVYAEGRERSNCDVRGSGRARVTIHCSLSGEGLRRIRMFVNPRRRGTYWDMGVIEASNR